MFSLSGELTRSQYFRNLAAAYAIFIVVAAVCIVAIGATVSDNPTKNPASELVSRVLLGLLLAFSVAWLYAITGLIIRRVRNTGLPVGWQTLAVVLNPVGFIVIGFIPSARRATRSSAKSVIK